MKSMNARITRTVFLLALAMLGISEIAFAGHIDVSQRIYTPLNGTEVKIGNPSATATVDLSPKTGSFSDARVIDVLEFGVDHHYNEFVDSAMDVRIVVHIEPYDVNDNPLTDFYESLTIQCHPFDDTAKFIDKDLYKFSNAYKIIFTIDSIFVDGVSQQKLPHHLYLDASIGAERYYDFSADAVDSITGITIDTVKLNCDTLYDEIVISWPVVTGAEEYQLEWTFVNDYIDSAAGPYLSASSWHPYR